MISHIPQRIVHVFWVFFSLVLIGCGGNTSTPQTDENSTPDLPVARGNVQHVVKRGESVTLDGSGSYAPDGRIVSCTWFENGTQIGSGSTVTIPAPGTGEHSYLLKVKDSKNRESNDTVSVRVYDWGIYPVFTSTYGFEPWLLDAEGKDIHMINDIALGTQDVVVGGFENIASQLFYFTQNKIVFMKIHAQLWQLPYGADTKPKLKYTFSDHLYINNLTTTNIYNKYYFFVYNTKDQKSEIWQSGISDDSTQRAVILGRVVVGDHKPIVLGDRFYFLAYSDASNKYKIWVSDGTQNGTKEIGFSPQGEVYAMTGYGNDIVCLVEQGNNNYALYRLDTSAESWTQLHVFTSSGKPYDLTASGSYVFLAASDSQHGTELWSSDGTSANTQMLKDIYPNAESSYPADLTVTYGGMLYFSADDGTHGRELWESDGTSGGTKLSNDIIPGNTGSYPGDFKEKDNVLYLSAFDAKHDRNIYKKTSTSLGKISDLKTRSGDYYAPLNIFPFSNNAVFYSGGDKYAGREPCWADPSSGLANYHVLKNIAPTSHDSNPSYKARVSQYLFFTADDLFHGTQLWRSDGTTAQMVQDHNTLGRDSLLRDITQINGAYYFAATDASRVWNLWKKDTDLKAVRQLSDYTWVVQLADKLYFVDGDRKNLMSLDPQTDAADTVKKFDIIDNYSLPVTLEEKLCLVAKQSGYNDIWCTDGTQTQKVTTFGNLSILTNIDYLSVMGDKLFFVASDGAAHGKEIFVTGLTGGPVILKDINPSGDSDPRYLTVMGDKLYFSANDGARGTELWSSDGTESGTRIVKDIRPNAASADPKDLFATDERLYFVADDGMHGRELWVSDGSPSGTHMVADAVTGAAGSKPNIIATYKNSLIYTALSGGESYLWLKPSANSVSLKVSKEKIFHAWKTGDMFEGALIESIATDGSKQLYLIGSDPDKSTLLWRE